jgi:methylated-DNA-[protein]-cysteine S-methyltransferase
MKLSEFEKKVLEIIKEIPIGRVTTYKEIARALESPRASRAVGNALSKNPDAPEVPCHRVVKSDGRLGGYAFGAKKKEVILKSEGLAIRNDRIRDFKNILYFLDK